MKTFTLFLRPYLLLLFIWTAILHTQPLSAQASLGYYPFQSELSITSNTNKILWGDMRLLTNTFWGNITVEPALMVNIKKSKFVNYYTGVGVNCNFFNGFNDVSVINGYSLNFGARIKPIENAPNLQCIFEIAPYMNQSFDGGLLKTRLGLAYQFKKKGE
ncbi:MAG: hypothetical protein AB8B69_19620 [Chitinophagales bacterium]